MTVQSLIVGALEVRGPSNKSIPRVCRVSYHYLKLMKHLMVSNTIKWSKDICIKHITGHHQYEESYLKSPARSESWGTD